MLKLLTIIAAAGMAAALFSGPGMADEPDIDPRIGEEVRSICFGRNINAWKALKGEDDVVLLKKSVRDWYRVELAGACDYRVLRSAMAIGIDSRPAGGCVSRGDVIIVSDSPGFDRRCVITKMYEWNEDAALADDDYDDDDDDDRDDD